MDGSPGDAGTAYSPALPLDVWHLAVFLEAQRHAFPPKAWHARLGCAAEHFCVSASASAHLSADRFIVPVVRWALGIGKTATLLAAHDSRNHGRLDALRAFLHWLSVD